MANKVLFSFKAPEYLDKQRSSDWFWAVGIISSAIIITSILFNNILLAVFLIITTTIIFIYAKRKPEIINIDITESGIKIGKNMYPYSSLKAFWINDYGDFGNLLLRSSGVINPLISIPIIKIDPEKIREILLEYIREEEIVEPLSQKIMEYLGF